MNNIEPALDRVPGGGGGGLIQLFFSHNFAHHFVDMHLLEKRVKDTAVTKESFGFNFARSRTRTRDDLVGSTKATSVPSSTP